MTYSNHETETSTTAFYIIQTVNRLAPNQPWERIGAQTLYQCIKHISPERARHLKSDEGFPDTDAGEEHATFIMSEIAACMPHDRFRVCRVERSIICTVIEEASSALEAA